MKSEKFSRIFFRGRKWVFTLALFLLVFAAASVVKIQAASVITGYLWGGSEDANVDGSMGVVDENDTMLYAISMNSRNCDVDGNNYVDSGDCDGGDGHTKTVIPYGVNIPASDCSGDDCNLSGYAWSPSLGYLSFNKDEIGSDCPSGNCWARRDGNSLKGWARFMDIKTEKEKPTSNSGGWGGWVSLSNPSASMPYGVNIINENEFQKCNPNSGSAVGCAWNGEESGTGGNIANGLGWIDFGWANVEKICVAKDFTGPLLNQSQDCRELVIAPEDAEPGQTISFAETSAKISLFDSGDSTCSGVATGNNQCVIDSRGECGIYVKGLDFTTDELSPGIPVSISGDCGSATAYILIEHTPRCIVDAPNSVEVGAGSSVTYDVTVIRDTGETGNCVLDNCKLQSGASPNITDAFKSEGESKCTVTTNSTSNYGSGDVKATAGTGSDMTKVYVKARGWIETTP